MKPPMPNLDDANSVSAPTQAFALRQRAETRFAALETTDDHVLTPMMTDQLVHELRVHQIELEMQNEELRRIQIALETSRERYFNLYELAPVGYLTLNEKGLIEDINLAAATLLDTPRGRLLHQPLTRFINPNDQDLHYRHRQQLWSTCARQSYEVRLRQANGGDVWVRVETTLAPDIEDGQPLWRLTLSDISIRKHYEQELLATQKRLQRVAEIAELTFWEWDPHTNEVFFPPEWWQQTGYLLGELPLRLAEWSVLLHSEDRERVLAYLAGFATRYTQPHEFQYRLRRKDGIYRWIAARMESILDEQGALARVLLVHQDVTRRKEFEEQAVRLAQHDPLTGLPSRALLDQLANHMLASTRRAGNQLAVLFFDLDGFKAVNDTYGHAMGDQLLKAVAHRLRDAFRAEDLVARLGGDEFVVVLANLSDRDAAAQAASTAVAALRPPYVLDGHTLTCVPSLGVSLYPQDGDTIDGLVQRADIAMYRAKQISPGDYQFAVA